VTRIYLDLDGVMADFDAHFPALFGVNHKDLLDDEMWSKINSHPSYFRDMPLCAGAKDFYLSWLYQDIEFNILTACSKSNYANVATQKRAWVREHLGWATVLPVLGGRNKWLFMNAPGDILIDDWEKNTIPWVENGGRAILHDGDFERTDYLLTEMVWGA